jgi:hypothetical protein
MCNDCVRLYDELQSQSAIMYGLRKRISSLKGELKYERQSKAKLIKEKKKIDHYRNGQKRGARGRNG